MKKDISKTEKKEVSKTEKKTVFKTGTKAIFMSLLLLVFLTAVSCEKTYTVKTYSDDKEIVDIAVAVCIRMCLDEKEKGTNLSAGPCISNDLIRDWVCDIAHDPRIEEDNNPENQCSAFISGDARHFVEIDQDCQLIRVG